MPFETTIDRLKALYRGDVPGATLGLANERTNGAFPRVDKHQLNSLAALAFSRPTEADEADGPEPIQARPA
jgi:hypothetical protein